MSGRIDEFSEKGCDVLGINTDSVETHERWLTTSPADGGLGPIAFPLASDPDGTVCNQYGVYVDRQKIALRGLFMIDPNGVLQYQAVHSLSVGRSTDEMLRVLDALQSGGLCPAERQVGQSTVDVLGSLGPNRVIGSYRIESELGSGAFGTVFRARDQLLDRTVALKVLRANDDAPTATLLAEARAAAALNHPNVCSVHSIDTSHGVAMIVMEYVEGVALSERLASGPVSTELAKDWVQQIAAGMAAAHNAGVIHGDLKPANLIVTPDETITIMDFGLARRVPDTDWQGDTVALDHSSSRGLSGTPGYMAPEMARGAPPTPESDVFALGLVIYEMLTGRRPVSGSSLFEVIQSVQELDTDSLARDLPNPFQALLPKTIASTPAERIKMAEVAESLVSSL